MRKVIAVGSKNKAKLRAVEQAFARCFSDHVWEVVGVSVESGVSNQPLTDEEAIKGAWNRARKASARVRDWEFSVGPEGGLHKIDNNWFNTGWVVVLHKSGIFGLASTSRILMPVKMMELIHQGHELGVAVDMLTGKKDTKNSIGHVGIMTKGILKRDQGFTDGLITALSRFLSPEFF